MTSPATWPTDWLDEVLAKDGPAYEHSLRTRTDAEARRIAAERVRALRAQGLVTARMGRDLLEAGTRGK